MLFFFTASAQDSPWDIPNPSKISHPGTDAAPASSPRTYPYSEEFQNRYDSLIVDLANYPIWSYRAGFFAEGNDPGKRVPAHAAARLVLDPDQPDALEIMNDDRSPNEHYHFAAVNWARYLPIFRESLTDQTYQQFSRKAATYGSYTNPHGTENHRTMWFTSGLVLPYYIGGDRIGNMSKEAAVSKLKEMLRSYVKGLYRAGQGEWDSSTYLVFDLNGLMNIYDFHPDEECQLLAKAALDWLVAGYALKYTDGVFCSPHKRGYAEEPVGSKTDETGWLWWGTESDWFPEDMRYHYVTFHALMSGYRPNKVLCNIATGKLPEIKARNTKPNYWFGQGISPDPNQFQESVYKTPHYTMGTLWHGYFTDISRFQLVVEGEQGGLTFIGGSPMKWHTWDNKWMTCYECDGNGKYDQSCQVGAAHITMTAIPPETKRHRENQYAFFNLPLDTSKVSDPVQYGSWYVIQADSAFLGLYPLVKDTSRIEYKKLYSRRQQGFYERRLYLWGEKTGFILQMSDMDKFASATEFANALQEHCDIDDSNYQSEMMLSYTTLSGQNIEMQYNPRSDYADVSVDGKQMNFKNWQLYDSPYISCKNSVLTVNDGREGFIVDFRGDLPVYKNWTADTVGEHLSAPQVFHLYQNYPNPFNPATTIRFQLKMPGQVKLAIYNSLGQKVNVLLDKTLRVGEHTVEWDGTTESGQPVASGVYFVKITSRGFSSQRKMVLMH